MDDEDLLTFALLLAGGFFLYRLVQQQRFATASAMPTFSPSAPGTAIPGAPIDRSLQILLPDSVSPEGQSFIKQREGFDITARSDGKKKVIGYGHDIVVNDPALAAAGVDQAAIERGGTITQAQAQAIFESDIGTVENAIATAVTVPLTQSQYDALADFIFNVGTAAFAGSTLLRLLNQGNYPGAAAQFSRWDIAGGQVSSSLERRRTLEQQMFSQGAATS